MTALYAFAYTPGDDDHDDADASMIAALIDAYVSQSALARVLNVDRETVHRWLHGVRPHPDSLERIAELYEHLTAWDNA